MSIVRSEDEDLEARARQAHQHEEDNKVLEARHLQTWGEGPPFFSEGSVAFWSALAEGRFTLGRCGSCRQVYFPPRVVCPACWAADAAELVETPGRGKLVSFTELHVVAHALQPIAPVRMAIVDLEEGVRVLTWLRGRNAASAAVGDVCLIAVERLLGKNWFVANLAD